ncbi:Nif3-like dinuclear metal center hexameric protein [Ammoniphilus sp. CFH 90114]|uniref:Nif3-like dinuclear metal center hexameric protein n=1 Tax=Ammoniphilus sp. CFH 90114 TaxID=2493665 RepID=UPI00100E7EC3|nr:Nif3-like dinuclear metal center hexameric protein [Ammoniphilus sp. CFH 90114]RXT15404.1 NGG1p interacting factor NIF3 [Ammoniphilus sp. CFH 90114]
MTTVQDVVQELYHLTGGRVLLSKSVPKEDHPFVIWKSSGIEGKEVLENPGLVYGDPNRRIQKIAVAMTLSEQDIELAAATGVDAIVAHHPIADGASSGGVTLRNYLDLYDIAVIELHEAFHGLHPGIPFLHGHKVRHADIHYGGKEGNVMYIGTPFSEIKTLGDILDRLDTFMALEEEEMTLEAERGLKGLSSSVTETSLVTRGRIFLGETNTPVQHILHIFPHTGFTPEDLVEAKRSFPEIDTVLASISRVRKDSPLVHQARKLGLNFIIGNCHVLEIYENGLPLAYALEMLLPNLEVVIFREKVTSIPLREMGNSRLREYGERMAANHLVNRVKV